MVSTAFILGISANFFLLVLSIPAVGLLFLRYYQTRVAQIRPMIAINIACIVLAINETAILITTDGTLIEQVLAPITILMWMVCFVGFAFFLAGLTRNSLFCKETALVLLLAGIVAGLVLAGSEHQIQAIRQYEVSVFETSFALFLFQTPLMIYVSFWGYSVLNKTRQFAVTPKQEQQQRIFTWGMSTSFFGPLIAYSLAEFVPIMVPSLEEAAFLFRIAAPNLLIGVGLLTIIIIYALNKEVIYLQPQQLYSLLIIENSGLPLFDFNFRFRDSETENREENRGVDVILTAGALKAITSFLKEAVGGQEEIREIVTVDRIIIAKAGEGYFSVLISDRASSFVHQALGQFTATFDKEYGHHIQDFMGKTDVFAGVDRLVAAAFGMGS